MVNYFVAVHSNMMEVYDKDIPGAKTCDKNKKNENRSKPPCKEVCDRRDLKLKEAEKTIANKDVIIKMLQDYIKKVEESYKQNMKETEDFRYKFCLASEQVKRLRACPNKVKVERPEKRIYTNEKENKTKQDHEKEIEKEKENEMDMEKDMGKENEKNKEKEIGEKNLKCDLAKWKAQCDTLITSNRSCLGLAGKCNYFQQIENIEKFIKANYDLLQNLVEKLSERNAALNIDPSLLEEANKEYNEQIIKLREEINRLKDENTKLKDQMVASEPEDPLAPKITDSLLETYRRTNQQLKEKVSVFLEKESLQKLLKEEEEEEEEEEDTGIVRTVSFSTTKIRPSLIHNTSNNGKQNKELETIKMVDSASMEYTSEDCVIMELPEYKTHHPKVSIALPLDAPALYKNKSAEEYKPPTEQNNKPVLKTYESTGEELQPIGGYNKRTSSNENEPASIDKKLQDAEVQVTEIVLTTETNIQHKVNMATKNTSDKEQMTESVVDEIIKKNTLTVGANATVSNEVTLKSINESDAISQENFQEASDDVENSETVVPSQESFQKAGNQLATGDEGFNGRNVNNIENSEAECFLDTECYCSLPLLDYQTTTEAKSQQIVETQKLSSAEPALERKESCDVIIASTKDYSLHTNAGENLQQNLNDEKASNYEWNGMDQRLSEIKDVVNELLHKQTDTCKEIELLKNEMAGSQATTQTCSENISKLKETIEEQKKTFMANFQEHKSVTDNLIQVNDKVQQELSELKSKIQILFENVDDLKSKCKRNGSDKSDNEESHSVSDDLITMEECKHEISEFSKTEETLTNLGLPTPYIDVPLSSEPKDDEGGTESQTLQMNNLPITDDLGELEEKYDDLENEEQGKDEKIKCINALISYYSKAASAVSALCPQQLTHEEVKQCKCGNGEINKYIEKVKSENLKLKTTISAVIDHINEKVTELKGVKDRKQNDLIKFETQEKKKVKDVPENEQNTSICVKNTSEGLYHYGSYQSDGSSFGSNSLTMERQNDFQPDLEIEDIYNVVRQTFVPRNRTHEEMSSFCRCNGNKLNVTCYCNDSVCSEENVEEFYHSTHCACSSGNTKAEENMSHTPVYYKSITKHVNNKDRKECITETCGEVETCVNVVDPIHCSQQSLVSNLQTYVGYLYEQLNVISSIEHRIEDLRGHINDP